MKFTPLLPMGACTAIALLALTPSTSQAANLLFTAGLSGAAESPPVASTGSGFSWVDYNPITHLLNVKVDFSDLIGNTTVAPIHAPTADPMTGTIGVATFPGTFPGFPAGVTTGSYDGTWDLSQPGSYTAGFLALFGGTAAAAEAGLLNAMQQGKAYVNVHTTFAPSGEIRGFLAPSAPEPGMGLMSLVTGLALVGTTLANRRRP